MSQELMSQGGNPPLLETLISEGNLRELVRTHVILTPGACSGGPELQQMAHFGRRVPPREEREDPGMSSKSKTL